MQYQFSTVIEGLSKYVNHEIVSGMNDLQEIMARIAINRILADHEKIKETLCENGVIRAMGIIDSDGYVDVDYLFDEIKKEIERKGKLVISIPMFGKITFNPSDIETIKQYATGARV
jgi:hypothetical protein